MCQNQTAGAVPPPNAVAPTPANLPSAPPPDGHPDGLEPGSDPAPVPEAEGQDGSTVATETRDEVRALAAETAVRFGRLELGLAEAVGKFAPLSAQIRTLSAKLDAVASGFGDSRLRTLVLNLLSLHGLAEEMARRNRPPDGGVAGGAAESIGVLARLLWQTVEEAGVVRIRGTGAFDPTLHCAVDTAACADPGLAGQIKEVIRPGFAAGTRVLQPAQVVVWKAPAPEPAAPAIGPGAVAPAPVPAPPPAVSDSAQSPEAARFEGASDTQPSEGNGVGTLEIDNGQRTRSEPGAGGSGEVVPVAGRQATGGEPAGRTLTTTRNE